MRSIEVTAHVTAADGCDLTGEDLETLNDELVALVESHGWMMLSFMEIVESDWSDIYRTLIGCGWDNGAAAHFADEVIDRGIDASALVATLSDAESDSGHQEIAELDALLREVTT